MNERQEQDFPTLPIGFDDLAALRSVISGYLAFLRRGGARTQQAQAHMRVLEGVHQRLIGISSQAVEVRIFLTVPEVEALKPRHGGFTHPGSDVD